MRVYSPEFDYLYNISSFLKLQEVKRYTGTSILTLVIAASSDAAHYLQKNGWIVTDEPYVIKHIKQELEEITVTAYGGHQLLKQRVTAPATGQYAIEHTGSADAVVKHFINQSKRGLPLATAAVQGGVTISDQSRWKNLGDEVERVLIGAGRGEKYTFDADNKQIIFDTYLGVDRSRGNADDNPPVVFDLKYRNISEYTYTEDATVEQTTVYVGGQGEGVDREIIVTGNDVSGIDRTEVFVDARDVELGDTAKLTERAAQATIPAAQTVSATAVADANLVYGVDYNLGDIVTTNVPVKRYVKSSDYYDPVTETIQVNQRITEVVITRENGAEHIDLTFGDQPITQTQIQRLRAEIAQLKAVEPKSGYLPLGGGQMTGVITTPNNTVGINIGDDARLADRNVANTMFLEGQQNADRAYINFSQTYGNHLGAVNGGNLTWRGSRVWDAAALPYETGTWTPTLKGLGNGVSATITFHSCKYTRIGSFVHVGGYFLCSSKNGMTGEVAIDGLPFVPSHRGFGAVGYALDHSLTANILITTQHDRSYASLLKSPTATVQASDISDTFSIWSFGIDYQVA